MQTLRDTDPELKKILKRDAVVNKDRMDYEPVLQLSKPEVLAQLQQAKTVIHTLMPDKYKVNDTNWYVPTSNSTLLGKRG